MQVDIKEPHHVLKNLTRICILADLTLILAWSPEEAGKIIETYKIYENKPREGLMEKSENSPYLNVFILTLNQFIFKNVYFFSLSQL